MARTIVDQEEEYWLSVKAYAQVFTKLSRYAPSIVAKPRMKMSKFVSGVFDLIAKECSMVILRSEMDIDCLVIYARCFEKEKHEERARGIKRCVKRHDGKCLAGTKGCYSCGGSDDKMSVFPILKARRKEMKKIRPNALQARDERAHWLRIVVFSLLLVGKCNSSYEYVIEDV
uniref:Gag-pol polyprotein n=1 Tax=Solanum tuberosum TaxID=4113 RepID=M1DQG8_SOLTU